MLIFFLSFYIGSLLLIWLLEKKPNKQNHYEFIQLQKQGFFDRRFVYLDPNFSKKEQQEIIKAFSVWSQATHGYLRWVYRPWPPPETKNGKHLLVFKLLTANTFVTEYLNKMEHTQRASGIARPNFKSNGAEEICLIIDRLSNDQSIFHVMLHEIWHIVMEELKHWQDQYSISSYYWYKKLESPTDIDLRAYKSKIQKF